MTIQGSFCHLPFKSSGTGLCWDRDATDMFAEAILGFDILFCMSFTAPERFDRATAKASMSWNTDFNRFCEGIQDSSDSFLVPRWLYKCSFQSFQIFSKLFVAIITGIKPSSCKIHYGSKYQEQKISDINLLYLHCTSSSQQPKLNVTCPPRHISCKDDSPRNKADSVYLLCVSII